MATEEETLPPPEAVGPPAKLDLEALERKCVAVLRTVYDPEIPVDIYELGLIYGLKADENGKVHVQMTLTTPACPEAGALPGEVEMRLKLLPAVREVEVELVWDPPWTPARMSEEAKLTLGMD